MAGVCLLLATVRAAVGGIVTLDLMEDASRWEVCEGDVLTCRGRPDERAQRWFGPTASRFLNVRDGATTAAVVRLPPEGRVRFEFRVVHARLRLVATTPGREAHPLWESDAGATDDAVWRAADVPLGLPAGTIARLMFQAVPPSPGGPALVDLRAVSVVGATEPRRPPGPRAGGEERPNVLLYVVDTLRADRLGCYGGHASSPNVDAFAAESLRFADAVANGPWTRPATASLLTGLIPPHHGAMTAEQGIRPDVPTLAELLHEAGYATGGFVANVVASAPFGFDRGFEHFRYYRERRERTSFFLRADHVGRQALRWMRRTPRPFFAYVHVADPHSPYAPPPRFRRRLGIPRGIVNEVLAEQRQCPMCVHDAARLPRNPFAPATVRVLSGLYDGEVALADACFGTLLSALRADGTLDRTLVVFAADHGEEFSEHGGLTHGKSLHDEVLHVPLVARLPGGARAGDTEMAPVQQVDVLPSILDVLGVPLPARTDGEPVFREPAPASRAIVSHLDHEGHRLLGVTDGRWRFVRELDVPTGSDASLDVYDRVADPGEHRSLAGRDAVLASYGRTQLARLVAERVDGPTTAIAPEVRQRLEALGYIGR